MRLEFALLLFYVVRLVMHGVELGPDRLQQFRGILCGFGQLAEMMLEVVHPLAAAGEWGAREPDNINFVLQLGEDPLLLLVGSPQLERPAEERSDERREVQSRRWLVGCGCRRRRRIVFGADTGRL